MGLLLKQSTAVNLLVLMIDSADHIAGKTGLTLTITAYKAGAAGATITPTVTERTNGLYQLALTSGHTDTLGQLVLHITGTAADPTTVEFQVVAIDVGDSVRAGLTALPNAAAEAAGGLYTRGSGAGQINQPANGQIDANTVKVGGTVQTAGDIIGDTNDIQARLPAALVGGRIDASVGAMAAGVVTAAAIADAAIDAATFAADTGLPPIRTGTAQAGAAGSITLDAGASASNDFYKDTWVLITGSTGAGQLRLITAYDGTTKIATVAPNWITNPSGTSTFAILTAAQVGGVQGNVTGSVGSVTGAVGSVTGNVGGNVVGSVASVTADVGITQAGADKAWGTAVRALTDKSDFRLSAAGVDDIWDEPTAGHTTAGTTGKALIDAGSAGDPWGTALPGAYGAGTAGKIVGDNLNATVSSRAAPGDSMALVNDAITAAKIAADAIGASELAADAVAEIVDAVWDEATAGHQTAGTTGKALTDAGSAGDPWNTALPGAYGVGTAGKIVGDNVNATISSRSSHSAADVWAVGARTLTSFGTLAQDIWDKLTTALVTAGSIGKLLVDNIDVAISSRLATAGYTVPPTVVAIGNEVQTRTIAGVTSVTNDVGITQVGADKVWGTVARSLTDKAGFALSAAGNLAIWDIATALLTTVGSIGKRLADNVDAVISAIKSKTDNLPANPAATTDIPTLAQIWSNASRTLTGSQGIKRNEAKAAFMFVMTDSTTHVPTAGLAVTAQRSIDGGVFGACANVVVEVGSGWYKIDLAAADLNGATIALKFTAAASDQLNIGIVTGAA